MFSASLNYIIWTLTAALYAPVFMQLYKGRWEMVDYTHAYFILPVSLFIAWRNRLAVIPAQTGIHTPATGKPSSHVPRPTSHGIFWLFSLVSGLLAFIFGWRQEYMFITTCSLIPVLFGILGFLYGPAAARAMAFPVLYLILLIPPPLGILDAITIPMRQAATVATVTLLAALKYPITRDGLMISLGSHQVYMGPACSGFRSLITAISLGLAYAYIINGTRRTKLILVGSIIPLALLGNFIRVTSVCLVTFYMGEATGTKFHDASGYAIFIILIAGLIGIEKLLEHCPQP